MSSFKDRNHLDLLIGGYIREKETEYELYMNIPDGINKIMHDLYPILLFKFGEHNPKSLQVNNDRTILKGNDPKKKRCNGAFVFADLGQYNDIGLNKGIHLWSIKSLWNNKRQFAGCYASIGITTEKNHEMIKEWTYSYDGKMIYWVNTEKGYHYHEQDCYTFKPDVIVTIKLNCDNWTVTYYKDTEEFKKEDIEPGQCYYLAMLCCGQSCYTHLQVVESPDELMHS